MLSKHRNQTIDLVKALGIIGVVFIHSLYNSATAELVGQIFRVAVPLFVIYFAYFLNKSLSKTESILECYKVIWRRLLNLLKPYLLFTLLYTFVFHQNYHTDPTKIVTVYLSGFGWSGQYFFIILFQVLILFPLFQKLAQQNKLALITFSLIIYIATCYFFWDSVATVNKISHRPFFYWAPYIVLGIILSNNSSNFRKISFGWVIFSLVLVPFEFKLLENIGSNGNVYLLPSILISSCMIAMYTIQNDKLLEKANSTLQRTSIYLSQRSLGVFLLNPLFLHFYKPHLATYNNSTHSLNLLLVILLTILTFVSCLITIELLKHTKLKSFVSN